MSDFSDLYSPTRTFLGDIGTNPGYSNGQLDLGISSGLLFDEAFSEGDVNYTGGRTITPDVTNKTDKARLSLRAAISLLSPQSGAFSYRTKVLSVTRENSRNAHLGYLQQTLRELEDGGVRVASETEWDQWLRGSIDAISKINRMPI